MAEDRLLEAALDAGAEDVKNEGEVFEVITTPAAFQKVKEALTAGGIAVEAAEVANVPNNTVAVSGEAAQHLLKLIEHTGRTTTTSRASATTRRFRSRFQCEFPYHTFLSIPQANRAFPLSASPRGAATASFPLKSPAVFISRFAAQAQHILQWSDRNVRDARPRQPHHRRRRTRDACGAYRRTRPSALCG